MENRIKSVKASAGLALILGGLVVGGCGSENNGGNASAEPGKSSAASSAQTKIATSGSSVASKPAAEAASGTATTPSAATSTKADDPLASGSGTAAAPPAPGATALIGYMPKECDAGRAYVHVGKILTGDALDVIEQWTAQQVAESKDPKKSEEVLKVLRNGGIEPLKSLKQLALCANKDDKKTLVAVNMDMSKAAKPGDVLAKAIEVATGKAPKKEEVDGVTYLQDESAGKWLAVIGKDTLLAGRSKEMLQAAAKGGGGSADFGDATSHVVWANITDKQIEVRVKEIGEAFDIKAKFNAGANAAKYKSEFEKILPELDKATEKVPIVKPLLPAVKATKLEAQGEMLNIAGTITKAQLSEFLNGLKGMKLEDIKKQIPIGR